jgi:hypothetical protein
MYDVCTQSKINGFDEAKADNQSIDFNTKVAFHTSSRTVAVTSG